MDKMRLLPCGEKEKCFGCTACAMACPTKAIRMEGDENGFAYPRVDAEKCTDCGLCRTVCPALKETERNDAECLRVFGAKNLDDEIRRESSSGGVFFALAETVLDSYANAVIYGCAYDDQIVARHERATDKNGLRRFLGSKYVQSELGPAYTLVKQDLDNGAFVLFSGTPCQIGGLKAFLRKDYENLCTLDIVCHGVMSPAVFKDHIRTVQSKTGKTVSNYYNRSKILGWGRHVEEIVFAEGGNDHTSALSQAYKHVFHTTLALRASCYQCPYCRSERESDITIGDFWGIENILPEFRDDLGVSVVLVNTRKGGRLWEAASDRLDQRPVDVQNVAWRQRNLREPTAKPDGVEAFWRLYHEKGYAGLLKRYTYCSAAGRMKLAVKKLLGRETNG